MAQDAHVAAPESNEKTESSVTPGAAQLFDHMGPYRRKFTTTSQEAQKYLNQGMIWIQAFNHEEAIRSFLKAASSIRNVPGLGGAWPIAKALTITLPSQKRPIRGLHFMRCRAHLHGLRMPVVWNATSFML